MTEHEHLELEIEGGIAVVTIDAPPVNVMTATLLRSLLRCSRELADDDEVVVVVLRSADPDFWIAHFDVEAILDFPDADPPFTTRALNGFHAMCELFRTMPAITIAEIDGRVGGGGAELAASLDLRYGSLESCVVCQPEVPLGIIPGGSGTQRWPMLTNRSRAIEAICGAGDIDAATAERWGWLTRALPAAELTPFVDDLARRIAASPRTAVLLAKSSIDSAVPDPVPGLRREAELFSHASHRPEAVERMRRFLELGGQTRAGEAELQGLLARLPPTS